ncbi:MAG: hypothetical protein OQJ98_01460 [Candidatus Pacebacteria bacterium]|nr:hypothetical protein [Candidatus Paceibacterota bacterium]
MSEKITTENVFEVDVPALALDSRFGSLVFENANKKLGKAQAFLKEVYDLGYQELLNESGINQVGNLTNKLTEHLEWLRNFDIGTVANAKQEHDNFESRIDGFYNDIYEQILMRTLPFLREERRRENPDQKQLDEEVKKAVQVRTELEDELKAIREETQKIRTANKQVGSAKGQRAAVQMAAHFDDEVERYATLSKYWLWGVVGGYVAIVAVLVWLGFVTASYVHQIVSLPDTVDTSGIWSAVISKLVILAALWYGLSFVIKNYNVNSHLAAVNRHRAAVARTLEDFIAVEQQQENPRLSEVLQHASEAMFKNVPIGFVSKTEREQSNPVLQIVNDLIGIKNNT